MFIREDIAWTMYDLMGLTTLKTARKIIKVIISTMIETLRAGTLFRISDFGTFFVQYRKPHRAYVRYFGGFAKKGAYGEVKYRKGRHYVAFRPSLVLRRYICES